MSTGPGRRMPSAPGGGKPRVPAVLWALPLGAFLLFNAVTGGIDLINAFTEDETRIDRLLEQKAAIEATVRAGNAPSQAAPLAATPPPAETVSAFSGANAASGCEPSGDDRFCLYTVQEGDSLAAIATRFGLDGGAIPGWELLFASNQVDLTSLEDFLYPGLVLRVPDSIGVLHLVLPGDSLGRLAEDYGVTTEDIATANALTDPDNVQIGDILFIPDPTSLPSPELPALSTEPESEDEASEQDEGAEGDEAPDEDGAGDETESDGADENEASEEEGADGEATDEDDGEGTDENAEAGDGEAGDEGDGSSEDGTNAEGDEPEARDEDGDEADEPEAEGDDEADESSEEAEEDASEEEQEASEEAVPDDPARMSWPVTQIKITNYMSARHPLGMDFGLGAAPRSPIMAAAGGTVEFAGGDACCSYGYYVIVDHGNGLQTLYAHLSRIDVRKGETVGRGQTLGIAGNTGYSRGVHLHFEVYKDGRRVDPMNYLPRD